jgi:hypothetical protein
VSELVVGEDAVNDAGKIGLADVIRDLRAELEAAIVAGDGAALRFELGPVELEVSVAVEHSVSGGAKVKFWVVEAGADGKVGSTGTQRVKLSLTPKMAVDGASPLVSGQAMPGER